MAAMASAVVAERGVHLDEKALMKLTVTPIGWEHPSQL